MNILYLGDINSIHDFKWISFFSLNKGYKTYFFTEIENYELLSEEWKVKLEKARITILPPIPNFSINNPLKTLKAISTIKKYLKEYNIDFLGEIPINSTIREYADKGEILVNKNENNEFKNLYTDIARKLILKLEENIPIKSPEIKFVD